MPEITPESWRRAVGWVALSVTIGGGFCFLPFSSCVSSGREPPVRRFAFIAPRAHLAAVVGGGAGWWTCHRSYAALVIVPDGSLATSGPNAVGFLGVPADRCNARYVRDRIRDLRPFQHRLPSRLVDSFRRCDRFPRVLREPQ